MLNSRKRTARNAGRALAELKRLADYNGAHAALARCEGALNVALLIGDTAWRIDGLIGAAREARAVAADWRKLLKAPCAVCADMPNLFFQPCEGCGR